MKLGEKKSELILGLYTGHKRSKYVLNTFYYKYQPSLISELFTQWCALILALLFRYQTEDLVLPVSPNNTPGS